MVIGGGWVLITDAGVGQVRSTLAAVRAAAAAGYRPAVTVSPDRPSLAASSRFCARRVALPPLSSSMSSSRFAQALSVELRGWPYVAVLPTSDAALVAL